jgi:hypothetical protein
MTRTRAQRLFQSMRNRSEHKGFGRAAGRYDREDFRPSSIGRTCSGLREPLRPRDESRAIEARSKESHARTVPESGPPIRSLRSKPVVVAGSRPSTILGIWFSEPPRATLRDLTQGSESKSLLSRRGIAAWLLWTALGRGMGAKFARPLLKLSRRSLYRPF